MKTFLSALLFVIIIGATSYFLSSKIVDSYNNETAKYKDRIGTKVVINKDTLLIMDYSILNGNFKLSNGTSISYDLVKKMPILK